MQQTLERPTENTAAPVETTGEQKVRPLTGHDRCDARAVNKHKEHKGFEGKGIGSCGAQAFVLAVLPSGSEILFCGHHAGKQAPGSKEATNIEVLKGLGAVIHDEYDTINKKPTM